MIIQKLHGRVYRMAKMRLKSEADLITGKILAAALGDDEDARGVSHRDRVAGRATRYLNTV
jgi:hypothetical protein